MKIGSKSVRVNDMSKKQSETKWRRILHPYGLAPLEGAILPLFYDLLCKQQGLDVDDDPTPDFRMYKAQIQAQIDKMHSLGIFHGDLHWKNIVFDGQKPLFIDFEYTTKITDMDLEFVDSFLELEANGYEKSVTGALAREREMPFFWNH